MKILLITLILGLSANEPFNETKIYISIFENLEKISPPLGSSENMKHFDTASVLKNVLLFLLTSKSLLLPVDAVTS